MAHAHDLFARYIQHRVAAVCGATHVDVTVQLTFFEEESERERKLIDRDGDGNLSRIEITAYLQELESRLTNAVALELGGVPLTLVPLRSTEIDFLGHHRTGRGHHCLTLYYFAPVDSKLKPGMRLDIHDRLWPRVRALGSIHAEGRDGCRVEALPASDPVFPPANENESRTFSVRLLSVPLPSPTGAASPERSAPGTSKTRP